MQNAQEYLNQNPDVDKVFSTSDGFLFKSHMYAMNHAATITDKKVTEYIRDKSAPVLAAAPAAETTVVTETVDGTQTMKKNETVDPPKITDSPVENKAGVIVEAAIETAKSATDKASK